MDTQQLTEKSAHRVGKSFILVVLVGRIGGWEAVPFRPHSSLMGLLSKQLPGGLSQLDLLVALREFLSPEPQTRGWTCD